MNKEDNRNYIIFVNNLALYLSKTYEEQYEEMEDFARWNLPEEIGLEWQDTARFMMGSLKNEGALAPEVISVLFEISDNFLNAFNLEKEQCNEIWSHEAMKTHPFWTKQRNLAKQAVDGINKEF